MGESDEKSVITSCYANILIPCTVLTIACRRLLLEGGLDDFGLSGEVKIQN